MTPPSVSEIVDGLTAAQRSILKRLPGKFGRGQGAAGRALIMKGLVETHQRFCFQYVLTPLGRQVESALREATEKGNRP